MLKNLLIVALVLPLSVSAQNKGKIPLKNTTTPARVNPPVAAEQPITQTVPDNTPATPTAPPPYTERFEIFASFSQGTRLLGYTDPRYVANDKTDYLESPAMTANLEFSGKIPYRIKGSPTDSALQDIFAGTEYLRIGGQLTGWSILNSSSVAIPKTGAPINADAVNANLSATTRPGVGFFFGFGKRDFEVDFGITTALAFEYEGNRTRRVVDANGNVTGATEEVAGRGLFIANAFVLPTFRLAWGARDDLQFFISAGRETFEYQRDYLQTYFRIPLAPFLKMDFGVGLFPNATLFLQPNVVVGTVMVGVRGGISLNYYESELRRVSVNDALYFALSASGRF
ncbi:MAG: hypothetical protein ACOY5B_14005 [Spirochaetota bacterium]